MMLLKSLLAVFSLIPLMLLASNKEEIRNRKPLIDHITGPRFILDLSGKWEKTEIRNIPYQIQENGKIITKYKDAPLEETTAVWKSCHIPEMTGFYDYRKSPCYRRTFVLPEKAEGKRVFLRFPYMLEGFDVSLNGKQFHGVANYGGGSHEFDVTSVLKNGENKIVLRLNDDSNKKDIKSRFSFYTWAVESCMGVTEPFFLEFRDPTYIDDVFVTTTLTPEKKLSADVVIKNNSDQDFSGFLNTSIENVWKQNPIDVKIPAHGETTIKVCHLWKNPKLWTPDTPNLYFLDLKLVSKGKPIDAYRQRFGFREVKIQGYRVYLNGHPILFRRSSFHEDSDENFNLLRKRGVNTLRVGVTYNILRYLKRGDETGMMIHPMPTSMNGAAPWKDMEFWKSYWKHIHDLVKQNRNHPCILYWSSGNEFGHIYGADGHPDEKGITNREIKAGKIIEQLDSSRFWTANGELDLGYPAKGGIGPAPTRSYHYPFAVGAPGCELPDVAYWLEDGRVPWQRINKKDKPVMISEDLYHGCIDSFNAMMKYSNDSIYTLDGYLKALYDLARMFAEGYYSAGATEWEPWFCSANSPCSRLYLEFPQIMPDFMISMRDFFPNLKSGEKEKRKLYAYNQTFTTYFCDLVCREFLNDKEIHSFKIPAIMTPGKKFIHDLTINTPVVSGPSFYKQVWSMVAKDGQILDTNTFRFNVYPEKKTLDIKGKTALLASKSSPLTSFSFPCGKFNNAADAVKSKANRIVVDKVLSTEEGRILDTFVQYGGRVLLIDINKNSWCPISLDLSKPHTIVWRRNSDRMTNVNDTALRSWKPDGKLGDSSVLKTGQEDSSVLFDVGREDGLTNSVLNWTFRGKGAWMICQLPVTKRFYLEPYAPWFLQEVINEFTKGSQVGLFSSDDSLKLTRDLFVENNSPYREVFEAKGFNTAKHISDNTVLFLDASKGLSAAQKYLIADGAKNGRTIFVSELNMSSNQEYLETFGIKLRTNRIPLFDPKTGEPAGNNKVDYINRIIRKDNHGLMAGISNDYLYLKPKNMISDFMFMYSQEDFSSGRKDTYRAWRKEKDATVHAEIVLSKNSSAKLLTEPGTIAEAKNGAGTIYFSTYRFLKGFDEFPEKMTYLLRTIFNNLSIATSNPAKTYEYKPVDISAAANRNFWNDPKYRRQDGTFYPVGWFGNENDLRFFPVNLCGWSIQAQNYCPKDIFPTEPQNYGGIRFKLIDPEKNGGRACIVLMPGETVMVHLPSKTFARAFYFFGGEDVRSPKVEISINHQKPVICEKGNYFGCYRWTCNPQYGRLVWSGYTLKDSMASLYLWRIPNETPEKEVRSIRLSNTSEKGFGGVGIIAITEELNE